MLAFITMGPSTRPASYETRDTWQRARASMSASERWCEYTARRPVILQNPCQSRPLPFSCHQKSSTQRDWRCNPKIKRSYTQQYTMFEILRPGKLPGDLLDIEEKNRVDFESLGPKMSILVFRAPDSPSNTKGVSRSWGLLKELPPLLHVCMTIFPPQNHFKLLLYLFHNSWGLSYPYV